MASGKIVRLSHEELLRLSKKFVSDNAKSSKEGEQHEKGTVTSKAACKLLTLSDACFSQKLKDRFADLSESVFDMVWSFDIWHV